MLGHPLSGPGYSNGGIWDSLLYLWLSTLILGLFVWIPFIALLISLNVFSAEWGATFRRPDAALGLFVLASVAFLALVTFVLSSLWALASSAVDYGVLKLLRSAPGPYRTTVRASAMSLAACAFVWPQSPETSWLYVYCIAAVLKIPAYRNFHQISWTKASFVALLFPALVLALKLSG